MGGEREIKERYDYYGDEEGAGVEEEDKQSQEDPEYKDQFFEETAVGRPRREVSGRGIDCLEPTKGGKSYNTNTVTQFFQIKEPKGERFTYDYYKATVNT